VKRPAAFHRLAVLALPWRTRLPFLWHRHLGHPGWIAALLLAAGALVHWQLRPLLQGDQLRLQERQRAYATAARALPASPEAGPRQPSGTAMLPFPDQRGRDLEWLVMSADKAGLKLDRADYTLGASSNTAIARVEATLPLVGSYAAVRQYIAAVLNEMPNSALESLQIERPNAQSTQLQATARLVLFYRQEAP
jgi:hypothetical protein